MPALVEEDIEEFGSALIDKREIDELLVPQVLRTQFGAGSVADDEGYLVVQAGEGAVPEMVRRLVLSIPGVHLCHKVRSRGTADAIYMDLHIHLDPTISLMEAHALTHKVIATIKENMPDVADVVIHTEPAGPHHD